MVKIAQAYNFPQQTTYSILGDISAATIIGKNKIAVASRESFIEIYNIQERTLVSNGARPKSLNGPDSSSNSAGLSDTTYESRKPLKHILPTIGEVMDLTYCVTGKYLVTLERDSHDIWCEKVKPSNAKCVRVYTNLSKFADEKLKDIPIAPRIASKVTPKSLMNDCVDLIEFPMECYPDQVTCCQSSGNILIRCKDQLFIYECRMCTHETHRFTYIDFIPMHVSAHLSFTPNEIIIRENTIACISRTYALVFKIDDATTANDYEDECESAASRMSKTSAPSSSNSFETDSLETSMRGVHTVTSVDFAVAQKANSACGREFTTELKSQWDNVVKIAPREDHPPKKADIKVKLISNGATDKAQTQKSSYDHKKLLQVHILHASAGSFYCMDLKPIYQTYVSKKSQRNYINEVDNQILCGFLKSPLYQKCVGFAFFIASSFEGYLYQFCNQDKWFNENSKPVATYPFLTSPKWVKIDNFVIHFITSDSVETYTSRVGHKIFSNRFEYPTVANIYPEESSPEVNAPLSIIGRCSFMDIGYVCVNDESLIMITEGSSRQSLKNQVMTRSQTAVLAANMNELTLYNVKIPNVTTVIEDIENMAKSYRESAPQRFYELTEEAHVMLRLALTIDLHLTKETRKALKQRFEENCRSLADFSIRSNKKEIYMQAIGFYKMCNVSPGEIYTHYMNNFTPNLPPLEHLSGLMYTIKQFLSELGLDKAKTDYLTQTTQPTFATYLDADGPLTEVILAVEFLSMFVKCQPDMLPAMMLSSPLLVDIVSTELIAYLVTKKDMHPDESLLLATATSRRANHYIARQVIEGMSRKHLCDALVAYRNVLFDDNFQAEQIDRASFSDLTEFTLFSLEDDNLIEGISDTFVTIVSIERTLDLKIVLPLFLNFFAMHIGFKGCRTSQRVLGNILQSYLYDFYTNGSVDATKSRDSLPTEETLESEDMTTKSFGIISGEYNLMNGQISCDYAMQDSQDVSQASNVWEPQASNRVFKDDSESMEIEDLKPNKSLTFSSDIASGLYGPNVQTNLNGLKILFRMYLGQLKIASDSRPAERPNLMPLRYECISFLASHVELIKTIHSNNARNVIIYNTKQLPLIPDNSKAELFIRPVPCLESRPQYLNKMPPFKDVHFEKAEDEHGLNFVGWKDDIVVLLLKLQALLSSTKTDSSIVEEFINFIQKSPDLIGIDSLITILLPKPIAMEFLINSYPELMWSYGKSNRFTPKHWELFIRKLLGKQEIIPNWKVYLNDVLMNLVADRTFEDLLQCFPTDVVTKNTSLIVQSIDVNRPVVMDTVDESNAFEVILRDAVAKQRSIALKSMIESTGSQFFDAANN